jgi:hypothetical protein
MLEALQEEQAANQERLFDLEKRYSNVNLSVYLHFEAIREGELSRKTKRNLEKCQKRPINGPMQEQKSQ